MIIDDRGKLFGKFSIVDIGVILIILALIAGGYYKFVLMGKNSSVARFDNIEYQFKVQEIRQQSVNAMEIGADVYDTKTGSYMGKITGKDIKKATDYIDMADGSIVMAEKPNRFDAIITVSVPGVETQYGFRANGSIDINRGSTQILETRMIIMEAQITNVRNASK